MKSRNVPSSNLRWLVLAAISLLVPVGLSGLMRSGSAALRRGTEPSPTSVPMSDGFKAADPGRTGAFGSIGSFFANLATSATPATPNIDVVFASNRDSRIGSFHHDDDCDRDFVGDFDIYGMKADGSGVVRLTNDGALDLDPALSPDKTKIAFMSNRAGNFEIYVMNVNGTGVTRLTNHSAFDGFPSWSPDGSKIVFKSTRNGNPEIYVMNSNGAGLTRLTTNSAIDTSPVFSPNGTKIAFVSNRDGAFSIYSMNSNGTSVTRLTSGALDFFPTWSPDGAKIAFMRVRYDLGEIYVMNANGSGASDVTNNPAIDSEPNWGPDNKILFTTTRNGNLEIYSMNPNGSGVTRLTTNSAWDISPNSQASAAATNSAPVVKAGANQTITLPANATLTGTATDDGQPNPPGMLALLWSQVSGPATANIATPNQLSTQVTFPTAGIYVFRLTASDSVLSSSATVQVTVNPQVNQPPNVSAGPNQTITMPTTVTLSGSASDDGLPTPPHALTYTWSQDSGPVPALVTAPTQPGTTANFTKPGVYVLRLTASDGALSSSATAQITVNDGPPVLSVADRTIPVGTKISIQLAANDPNPNDALTYFLDASPTGTTFSANMLTWTPTAAQVGSNAFTARVNDANGHSDTKTFHINVTPANQPPKLGAQADERVPTGGTFSRTLTATDPDAGDVLTFALLSGPAGLTINGNRLSWSPATTTPGDYFVKVKVTDNAQTFDATQFKLTVFPVSSPAVRDDSYETSLGQTLNVAAPGVLGNDADPNGGTLTAAKLTDPDKGSISSFASDGSLTYVPPAAPQGPVLDVKLAMQLEGGGRVAPSPLLIADIDGDGRPDIITNEFAGPYGELNVYRTDDGSKIFHFTSLPTAQTGSLTCNTFANGGQSFAVGDVDDDGRTEIVLPVQCNGDIAQASRLAAVSYDPTVQPEQFRVKWISAPTFDMAGSQASTFSIARLKPTDKPSVLVAHSFRGFGRCNAINPSSTDFACRAMYSVNGADGSIIRMYFSAPADQTGVSGSYDQGGAQGAGGSMGPVVADIDNDGALEILYEGTLWNIDGTIKRQFDGNTPGTATQSSVVVDLDGDAQMEIVTLDDTNSVFNGGSLKAWKADGRLLWQTPVSYADLTRVTKLQVADVDRDGRPDFIFGIGESIWVVDQSGHIKWIKHLRSATDGFSFEFSGGSTAFPVYDLNGDGIPEVLVQYGNNTLRFLRGDTGEDETSWTVPGSPLWQNFNSVTASPVVADIDNTAHASVLFYHGPVSFCGCETLIQVLKGDITPWRPAPTHYNQRSYWESNFNADGSVPTTYRRQTTDPRTNVFNQQPQAPYAPGFIPASDTSFTYSAMNTAGLSATAKVNIHIAPNNRPPKFVTKPPQTYVGPLAQQTLDYAAHAVDPDPGDTITYAVVYYYGNNSAASVDANTGLVHIFNMNAGDQNFIISATDNHGAASYQAFTLHMVSGTAVVPSVVGGTLAAATNAITSAQLIVGDVTPQFDSAPPGAVIAQSPTASTVVNQGESIDLIVSQGPAPVAVTNVVGTTQSTANSTLSASGFTTTITRAFSNTIPAGIVISQAPVAGTFLSPTPANPVALTVSAGNGLSLALNRSVATADQTITITPQAFDVNGNPTPAPTLLYAITPHPAPFAGLLPTITGTTINFDPTTTGSFTITATDTATSRTTSADFAVLPPRVSGQIGNGESFAHMSEVLASIYALKPQLKTALANNDTAQMTTLLQQIVTLWRQVDLDDLRISMPLVTRDQFAPTIDMMAGFGQSATADDVISHRVLKDSIDDLSAWTNGLKSTGLTITQLNALADEFSTRAARMDGLTISEYGGINNSAQYTRMMSHEIPDFFEALTNELAQLTGMPRRQPSFQFFAKNERSGLQPGALSTLPVIAKGTLRKLDLTKDRRSHHARRTRTAAPGTLAEQLVTVATQYVVDKIMDGAATTYKNAKQYAVDIMWQSAWTATSVAITHHLRQFLKGKNVDEVFSGASLSFREFQQAPAWIEADASDDPKVNIVIMIGPDLFTKTFQTGQNFVGNLQEGYSMGQDVVTNPKKYQNMDKVKNDLAGMLDKIKTSFTDFADAVEQQSKLAMQSPDEVMNGCLLPSSTNCRQLIYNNGFMPVYTYDPPPGFQSLGGLPVPIIFIVYDSSTGGMSFGTPAFMPCGYVDDDNNPNTPKKIQCPNSTPFLPR